LDEETSMPLHPVIQNILQAAKAASRPALSAGTPAQARAQVAAMRGALGSGAQDVAVESLQLPTRSGSIAARLYRPKVEPRGLVLYLHGGGWVCGELDDFDALSRTLAAASGCAVLLVDYRLAPEHPFPAALHDADDALAWAADEGMKRLGGRVPLVVAGDSAGANLGIAAVLAARGRVEVAFQAYFYPVTDSDFTRPSYTTYSDGMPLTQGDMRWFFGHYAPEAQWGDERISVLRTPDVSGSPRTWVATAEYDVLRDEGEAYAQRLREAGVEVELHRIDGLPHGFARLFNLVDTARDALARAAEAIAAGVKSAK
jgi:acetyl esterase